MIIEGTGLVRRFLAGISGSYAAVKLAKTAVDNVRSAKRPDIPDGTEVTGLQFGNKTMVSFDLQVVATSANHERNEDIC